MSRSMKSAVVTAAVLFAMQGTSLAQQPPAAGDQPPQTMPSGPGPGPGGDGERPAWWDWHEWMMGRDDEGGRHDRRDWRGRGDSGVMHSRMTPMMLIVMMDTNGDGSLSYAEIDAVHKRLFTLFDTDKNGELSVEELQAAMAMMGKGND